MSDDLTVQPVDATSSNAVAAPVSTAPQASVATAEPSTSAAPLDVTQFSDEAAEAEAPAGESPLVSALRQQVSASNNVSGQTQAGQSAVAASGAANPHAPVRTLTDTAPNGTAEATNISKKISDQMRNRGWSDSQVSDTINDPTHTAAVRDTRNNPATGTTNDDPATQYYREDGHYVVRNDNSGDVVQVSNTKKPDWVDSRTNTEIHPRPSGQAGDTANDLASMEANQPPPKPAEAGAAEQPNVQPAETAPVGETPPASAPAAETPTASAPAAEAPTTPAPAVEAPTTPAPAAEAPTLPRGSSAPTAEATAEAGAAEAGGLATTVSRGLGGVAMVGGAIQTAQGINELRHGNVVDGTADSGQGVSSVVGGAAVIAGGAAATVAAPIAFGAGALLDGGRDVVHGLQTGNHEQVAVGGTKGLGGSLLVASGAAAATGVGLPVAAGLAIAGGAVYAGASIYEHRQAIGHAISSGVDSVEHGAASAYHTVAGWFGGN